MQQSTTCFCKCPKPFISKNLEQTCFTRVHFWDTYVEEIHVFHLKQRGNFTSNWHANFNLDTEFLLPLSFQSLPPPKKKKEDVLQQVLWLLDFGDTIWLRPDPNIHGMQKKPLLLACNTEQQMTHAHETNCLFLSFHARYGILCVIWGVILLMDKTIRHTYLKLEKEPNDQKNFGCIISYRKIEQAERGQRTKWLIIDKNT